SVHSRSEAAFAQAQCRMPGGVSSPVRAYRAVGRDPIFISSGSGAEVTDVDGRTYIDYVGSYGPLILGHAPPAVIDAVTSAAHQGTSFGMPTEFETHLAKQIIEAVASIECVRFVNSGTEATMSAVRLARAATGRSKVVKCTGCYHGHSDGLLVEAGSGATTLGEPSSPGVPASITHETVLVDFNNLDAMAAAFKERPGDIAAVMIEPVAGNMGCILPTEGYLEGLRDLCDQHDALLIFDEVMTGFRVERGGAQARFNVQPDLTCLGKVIGGGLPCAAYGGRDDLMRQVAPDGPVYQAGTLSGNPLAMTAGTATLEALTENVYEELDATSHSLASGLARRAAEAGVAVSVTRCGSMVACFFRKAAPTNYAQATDCDTDRFAAFFRSMLESGIILPPSQYETWFVSAAHTPDHIERTLDAAGNAFAALGD
ncbi:MAG: glutamate-1-semialdehyde 2,1-aminomutase, partial [Phycisphaeraceae bacterium]|nr:glutamate-1-semialdehyde 2,1-aminomutase [Phycisphaeraceae bacterium]